MSAAKPLQYNASLSGRLDLTDKLAVFRIRPDRSPNAGEPWFDAGQYVTVGLNNTRCPQLGSVRRPMSVASPPQQTDSVDIYVRYVDRPESDNPLTALLWQLGAGDRCYLKPGATGRFTLAGTVGVDDPRRRLCVAAGTGLAPFVSMFEDLAADPQVRLDAYAVLHGVSRPEDLGYRARLQQLAAERGLYYLPTVSRPAESPGWGGACGRVEDFFLPERLADTERRLRLAAGELNGERCAALICGLQGTLARTLERLLPRGFIPQDRKLRKALRLNDTARPSLFWEQYDNTPVFNVKDATECARLRALLERYDSL